MVTSLWPRFLAHPVVLTARRYASVVLAMALCLSVTRKSEFYQIGCVDQLFFGMDASFDRSYHVLSSRENSSISKIRNFAPKSGLTQHQREQLLLQPR